VFSIPTVVLLTDSVFIGEDDNSGGGSEAGLDASETYTLDVSGVTPHPNQGVHVKLTVHADGSQGADTKYKVFWVSGCPTPTSPPPTSEPSPTSEPPHTSGSSYPTDGGSGSPSLALTGLGGMVALGLVLRRASGGRGR
jgi:hypothetical protein